MKRRMILFLMLITGLVFGATAADPALGQTLGLTTRQGELLLHGEPYRGIGANYFSLFRRVLEDPNDTSFDDGLKRLSEAGIPFVRFMACGFWPSDGDLYRQDKEAYFQRLDRVVESAEQHRIGLIPSLFWHMATVPDLVSESMDQLGNPDSETSALLRQYIEEVVLRYRDSPAIWAWEFGNEYNLNVDLPNAAEHRPQVVPHLKTALQRTSRDELSSQAMLVAFAQFANSVRQHDRHRVLITGNSIPRPSAYHNTKESSWEKDTPLQFEEVLLRDNPDPFEVISVHIYDHSDQAETTSIKGSVQAVAAMAARANKPLFVGEFGAAQSLTPGQTEALFDEMLDSLLSSNVALAAFWVFDYSDQDDWNVTTENERSYQLKRVSEANERLRSSSRLKATGQHRARRQ